MKEFIEKLIGRLEEYQKVSTVKGIYGEYRAYSNAIGIVNQLAEEYNNDFCEWKIGEYGDLWKPSCGDTYELRGVRRFKFCPYCGKKIKVVE